ncbi:MAG: HlyD family efflux transporter periplasmic adaptor subunit [Chloroflexi bacterium]|nr:HlyD family efflux transporter periplasmic adaptor subunit [Chloroflexota bacterium]
MTETLSPPPGTAAREAVPPSGPRRSPPSDETQAPPARRNIGVPRPPGFLFLFAGAILVGMVGLLYWNNQITYVATDLATIEGTAVSVASPANGQIRSIPVEIGDDVSRGQVLATISGGTAAVPLVSVRAPIDGLVVARSGNPGETATAGRPLVVLVDPTALWVEAQIDEGQIGRVRPGQCAEVTVNALGQTLLAQVETVGRVSASTSARLAQGTNAQSTSPFRGAQLIPVRLRVNYGQLPLVLGTSASVKIWIPDTLTKRDCLSSS